MSTSWFMAYPEAHSRNIYPGNHSGVLEVDGGYFLPGLFQPSRLSASIAGSSVVGILASKPLPGIPTFGIPFHDFLDSVGMNFTKGGYFMTPLQAKKSPSTFLRHFCTLSPDRSALLVEVSTLSGQPLPPMESPVPSLESNLPFYPWAFTPSPGAVHYSVSNGVFAFLPDFPCLPEVVRYREHQNHLFMKILKKSPSRVGVLRVRPNYVCRFEGSPFPASSVDLEFLFSSAAHMGYSFSREGLIMSPQDAKVNLELFLSEFCSVDDAGVSLVVELTRL